MSSEAAMAKVFERLDRSLRSAAVASLTPDSQSIHEPASWFGGNFFGLPQESWPESNGRPMDPLLQFRLSELPYVPAQLKDIALLNVFVDYHHLPTDLPAINGDGWLIRTYASLDGLQTLSSPVGSTPRPCSINWRLAEQEGPSWKEAGSVVDRTKLRKLAGIREQFDERYQRSASTKVGGWPEYIQSAPEGMTDHFVFQIASETKADWAWGDAGRGYFYCSGLWMMHWDCF